MLQQPQGYPRPSVQHRIHGVKNAGFPHLGHQFLYVGLLNAAPGGIQRQLFHLPIQRPQVIAHQIGHRLNRRRADVGPLFLSQSLDITGQGFPVGRRQMFNLDLFHALKRGQQRIALGQGIVHQQQAGSVGHCGYRRGQPVPLPQSAVALAGTGIAPPAAAAPAPALHSRQQAGYHYQPAGIHKRQRIADRQQVGQLGLTAVNPVLIGIQQFLGPGFPFQTFQFPGHQKAVAINDLDRQISSRRDGLSRVD